MLALNNVDLDVERSQMLVLLGPSGCGKTTLLRCIGGLETPTARRCLACRQAFHVGEERGSISRPKSATSA